MAGTYRNVNLWGRDGYRPLGKPSSCTKHLNKRKARRQHSKLVQEPVKEMLEDKRLDRVESFLEEENSFWEDYNEDDYMDDTTEYDLYLQEEDERNRREMEENMWHYDPYDNYHYDMY
jgi:hypothetical protein